MLLTLLGLTAAGALGYNCVKDEEHRKKTMNFIEKTADYMATKASESDNADCRNAAQRYYESKARNLDDSYDEEY